MNGSPLVSVIIAVRNGERFLSQALDSVLCQSLADFEVVTINDGSTDSTESILREYARQDRRVRFESCEPRGVIASRNAAVFLAHGEYLAMLDADDVAFPSRLELQTRFLQARPEIGVVGGRAVVVDENNSQVGLLDYPESDREIRMALPETNPFCHSATLIRRSAFESVGGYRPAFKHSAEDYDLWLRISERWHMANLHEPVVYYRWHASQASSTREAYTQFLETAAARLSHRMRRARLADPLDGCETVSDETLRANSAWIGNLDSDIVATAASRAAVLVSLGGARAALDLLDQVADRATGGAVDRQAQAQFAVAHARASSALGSFGDASAWLIRALQADPGVVRRSGWRGIRTAVRHRLGHAR